MVGGIFDPEFDQLPARIPIFPLPSALLLPGGQLPLNIFEPRYLAMVTHALSTPSRLIGMVQPLGENTKTDAAGNPLLFEIGCAGRLSFFQESDNGRFVIALTGLCRFNRRSQQLDPNGFLVADVDWHPFAHDLRIDASAFDRGPLIKVMSWMGGGCLKVTLLPGLHAVGCLPGWRSQDGSCLACSRRGCERRYAAGKGPAQSRQ